MVFKYQKKDKQKGEKIQNIKKESLPTFGLSINNAREETKIATSSYLFS